MTETPYRLLTVQSVPDAADINDAGEYVCGHDDTQLEAKAERALNASWTLWQCPECNQHYWLGKTKPNTAIFDSVLSLGASMSKAAETMGAGLRKSLPDLSKTEMYCDGDAFEISGVEFDVPTERLKRATEDMDKVHYDTREDETS